LAPLLAKIHGWLVPDGWLLAGFGTSDTEAWTEDWLGAPMFFSSFPPETTSRLVGEAGFEPVRDEVVTSHEPEPEEHEAVAQWILARRATERASFLRPGGRRPVMDWRDLERTLTAACEQPEDGATAEQAVRAAELVASTAGEPPDDLSAAEREWAETHGVPPERLVDLACRSMKCVAALSDDWHERLNDLRYRLGDVAAR
ncbi:MAG: hypothetical protein ACRDLK_01780, partial [Gaiellaceae bacterium]